MKKIFYLLIFTFFSIKPGLISWLLHGNKKSSESVTPIGDIIHSIQVIRSEADGHLEKLYEAHKKQNLEIQKQQQNIAFLEQSNQTILNELKALKTKEANQENAITILEKENVLLKKYLIAATIGIGVLTTITIIKAYKSYKKSKSRKN